MKRRGFFGAMAGIFGAPIAANAVMVTKTANDAFGEDGKLVERDVPKDMQIGSRDYEWTACTMATGIFSSPRMQWDDKPDFVTCNYCGGREVYKYLYCRRCGAPS